MATNYKITGGDVLQEPNEAIWAPKRVVGVDHLGAPHFGPYRTISLVFDVMTETNFAQWDVLDDGAVHTLTIPHPDTGVFTQYTNVYVLTKRARRADINVYDVEFEITRVAV